MAIQPYKNIQYGSYKRKVSRASEIITNFGTKCTNKERLKKGCVMDLRYDLRFGACVIMTMHSLALT
jgi:hypothetical protein